MRAAYFFRFIALSMWIVPSGITTEITGEGESVAPLTETLRRGSQKELELLGVQADWQTFRQYFARLERQGIGINVADYVGATTVRRIVLGDSDVQPTPAQLDQMKQLVRQAMLDGAVGVSTFLEHPQAPYAKTEELIALASETARYGGIYATHQRSESTAILQSLDEVIRIAREAHIPFEVWHFKVAGKPSFGHMPEAVAKIEAARDNDSSGASPEGILGREHAHPRAYGTFPRILRKYVREEHKVTLEDAIRKFSALPAQRLRLEGRGLLRVGMWADVTIFDPATIRDLATFDNPNQLSQGMDYVLVNGVPVIDQGKMTGARPDKVLRGPGYVP